ncbi:MAG: SPOR domain-containing protein [Deltaproteobacteria bacterium]|jgi:cell division septation protein DedD|nr:SPOR domain-containing protein [Deltaproteobacteria bacterium]
MKQTVKPKKKMTRPKKSNQFAIEMDVKGISFFLFLGLAAALLVFYLGYVFGKATRDPNTLTAQTPSQIQAGSDLQESKVQKNLKIFDLKEDAGTRIKKLKKSSSETLNSANKIIAASKEQTRPVVAPKQKKRQPTTTKNDSDFTPKWPDSSQNRKGGEDLYTFQIITTKNFEKASSFVKQLKRKGFDAYKDDVTIENKKLYRVRVGRKSRSQMLAIEEKLKKVVSGMGKPRLTKIVD